MLKEKYSKLNEGDQGYVLFEKNKFTEGINYTEKTIAEVVKDSNLARIIIEEWLKDGIVEEAKPIFRPRSNFFRLTPEGFKFKNCPIYKEIIQPFFKFIMSIFNFLKP
ncbi:MAG: hypothetical protein ACP5H7_03020 [Minisyncoccia bacterium]